MNGFGTARGRMLPGFGVAIVLSVVAAGCGGGDDSNAVDDGNAVDRPSSEESDTVAEAGGDLRSLEIEMPDGTRATLGQFVDGTPLVLNFFASWCAPCRAEMPGFAAVHRDVGDRVNFLGLAMQDTKEASAELVELTGIDYPWGLDPTGEVLVELGGFAMPTTVYITADGEIVGTENGAIDESQLRDRISDLFGVEA